jgi:serine/threonine protein kinase
MPTSVPRLKSAIVHQIDVMPASIFPEHLPAPTPLQFQRFFLSMSQAEGPIPVGEFVGPYCLGALIQETPKAVIYESYHPEKCEKLAIKLIKKYCQSPQLIEDECALMLELKSDVIIRALDIFDLDAYRCIVLPYAVGGDLLDYIMDTAPISEDTASRIMYTALCALDYLHSMGIWHRDVKPDNFLIMEYSLEDPRIVLADLGLARRFETDDFSKEKVGVLNYWAPEIIDGTGCLFIC